jgi:hypothetical protein
MSIKKEKGELLEDDEDFEYNSDEEDEDADDTWYLINS